MPPLDVQLAINTQVWLMLRESPAFAAEFPKEALQLNSDESARTGTNDQNLRASADAAKIKVDVADETVNERAPKVFGQNSTTFTATDCDYGVPMKVTVTVKIVHGPDTKLHEQTPKEAAVRGALLARGRTLGIPWVTDSVMRDQKRREESSPDTNGKRLTVKVFRLEISARPLLSLLTAGSLPEAYPI